MDQQSILTEWRPRVDFSAEGGITVSKGRAQQSPGEFHFEVVKGAPLELTITWVDSAQGPVLVAGGAAKLVVRASFDASAPALALSETAGIVLRDDQGPNIVVTMTAAETAGFQFIRGVYELQVKRTYLTIYEPVLRGTIVTLDAIIPA